MVILLVDEHPKEICDKCGALTVMAHTIFHAKGVTKLCARCNENWMDIVQ